MITKVSGKDADIQVNRQRVIKMCTIKANHWLELVKHLKETGYCITDFFSDEHGYHYLRGVRVGKGSIKDVLHNLKGNVDGMAD